MSTTVPVYMKGNVTPFTAIVRATLDGSVRIVKRSVKRGITEWTARTGADVRTVEHVTMCQGLAVVHLAGLDPCVKSLALRELMVLLVVISASVRMVGTVILSLGNASAPQAGREMCVQTPVHSLHGVIIVQSFVIVTILLPVTTLQGVASVLQGTLVTSVKKNVH